MDSIVREIREKCEFYERVNSLDYLAKNTAHDWSDHIFVQLHRIRPGNPSSEQRAALVAIAAHAILAVKTIDRRGSFRPYKHASEVELEALLADNERNNPTRKRR